MVILNLYSNRIKAEKANKNDVYIYDCFSKELKIQIFFIIRNLLETIYKYCSKDREDLWISIYYIVSKEWGKKFLDPNPLNFIDRFESYIVKKDNKYEHVLDRVIGIRITILSKVDPNYKFNNDKFLIGLIEELNKRFLYAGVGYQYENGEIIRIDHQYVHKEIVKPALEIIHNQAFEKVNEEYSNAHKHYRNQYIKDCIVACNRAFESLLKSICNECEWEYDPNNRASDLIKIIHKNGLFPVGMEKTIDSYIMTLKTGVPELRSHFGGHGSSSQSPSPSIYMAEYVLHLTATNIVFFI